MASKVTLYDIVNIERKLETQAAVAARLGVGNQAVNKQVNLYRSATAALLADQGEIVTQHFAVLTDLFIKAASESNYAAAVTLSARIFKMLALDGWQPGGAAQSMAAATAIWQQLQPEVTDDDANPGAHP